MKLKLSALLISLSISGHAFSQNVDDVVKAAETGKAAEITNTSGIVKFPSGVMGGTGSATDWRFSNSTYNRLVKNAQTFKVTYLRYAKPIEAAAAEVGFDPTLIKALSAKESSGKINAVSPATSPLLAPFNTSAYPKPKHFQGLYQMGSQFMTDTYQATGKYLRGQVTKLDDRLDPFKGALMASVGLKHRMPQLLRRANGKLGLPYNNMINVLRAYNGGQGLVINSLKSGSYRSENFQYPYVIGLYYYAMGGTGSHFVDLFSGRDEYLAARGVDAGKAEFNIKTMGDDYNVQPYKMPKRECKFNDGVNYGGKLPVSNPYGERFDYEKRAKRFNTTVDFGVPVNTEIKAMADGKVIGVKRDDKQGTILLIQYGNSAMSYGSLSRISVTTGEVVKQGQVMAYSGENNAYKTPLLMMGYFPDANGNLSTEERNENIADPLSVFCQDVDVPADMLTNAGSFPQLVSDVKSEQANSLSGAIEAMIKNRLGNKQWLSDLATMSEPRLYAEYAYQQMIEMMIAQRERELNEKLMTYQATYLTLEKEYLMSDKIEATRQDAVNQ